MEKSDFMKQNAHPKYQDVLFIDSSTGHKFVCGSTMQTDQTDTFNGKKYPAVHVPISSSSHPFFVGGKGIVDTEGRVDKFTKRYAAAAQKAQAQEAAATEKKAAEEKPKAKKKAAKAA
jgi:large subunit ribosomal protein L31